MLNQLKLVYGPFGQINMHSTLDFCPTPARKEMNVTLHKRSYVTPLRTARINGLKS